MFGFDHYCLSRSVSMPPSSDTDDFRRILTGSHEIVVIAGAGLSAGSGEISSDSSHLPQIQLTPQAYPPFALETGYGEHTT